MLEEAEQVFGPSVVLDRERQMIAEGLHPPRPGPRRRPATVQYNVSLVALAREDNDTGLAELRSAQQASPNHSEARSLEGRLQAARGPESTPPGAERTAIELSLTLCLRHRSKWPHTNAEIGPSRAPTDRG
jgi:hypothetical protein